jgi:hypothetical protein
LIEYHGDRSPLPASNVSTLHQEWWLWALTHCCMSFFIQFPWL